MTDWERVFEIADELGNAFELQKYHYPKNDMSYFHKNDIPKVFDPLAAARVLSRLRISAGEFKNLLDEKVRAATPTQLRNLSVNERVFLWLHVPSCRDVIKFDDLPEAAQAFLYLRDGELFDEIYDPNASSARVNTNILRDIDSREIFVSFFKKINDENLAKIIHRYPLDFERAVRAARMHRKNSKLRVRIIRIFDCSKVRNQSYLRAFIQSFPWVMTNQTLEMMEASPIKRDTWARLIGELKVEQRQYFPAGTGPWARRGIFVKHLKGKNSKPYRDFETGLPVDTSGEDAVKCKHEHDLSTDDTLVETP